MTISEYKLKWYIVSFVMFSTANTKESIPARDKDEEKQNETKDDTTGSAEHEALNSEEKSRILRNL
ncbi:MAG: hypothetical protein R6U04_04225 [Bacteroidales bacterium]